MGQGEEATLYAHDFPEAIAPQQAYTRKTARVVQAEDRRRRGRPSPSGSTLEAAPRRPADRRAIGAGWSCRSISYHLPEFSFAMGPIPPSWLRPDRVVAASVSEWMSCHSLTLAATPEMKKMRENWHRDGLIKCPGACPGILACPPQRGGFRSLSVGAVCIAAETTGVLRTLIHGPDKLLAGIKFPRKSRGVGGCRLPAGRSPTNFPA